MCEEGGEARFFFKISSGFLEKFPEKKLTESIAEFSLDPPKTARRRKPKT
jgi:hypothetical protein